MFLRAFRSYQQLRGLVLNLIVGGFFIKLINASFFLLFNLFLAKQGYSDTAIANLVSFRFLGMLAVAVPLGFMLKSRSLKPLFYTAGIVVPLSTLLVVLGVYQGWSYLVFSGLFLGGAALSAFDIAMLPFILRNEAPGNHASAIALNFSTFSLSIFLTGLINFLLPHFVGTFFTEGTLMALFAFMGLTSLLFIHRIHGQTEVIPQKNHSRLNLQQYDWGRIANALIPKVLLATGAGLTIQFINLFFYQVFGIDFNQFSLMATLMAILVVVGVLLIPSIKQKLGYSRSIGFTQFSAALVLVLLATTQYFSFLDVAVFIAMACFVIRQPLMNMANPITSELTMHYVGPRNQELVSALNASIWAGSRFFSAQIFRWMRSQAFEFATIFLTTALLYALATSWYLLLVRDYHKREKSPLEA